MRNLFFFGTLRHVPLLEVVLGRKSADIDAKPGVVRGYRVSAVAEGPFPTIEAEQAANAEGLAVSDLTAADIARLDYYEGAFGYDLASVTLEDGSAAELYLPEPGRWTADGPWSLDGWVAAHGEMSVIAAREVMGYFGIRSRDEVAAMFVMIRARADSQVRAKRSRHGSDVFRGTLDVVEKTRPYVDFYAMDAMRLRHAQFDGSMSAELDRAIFVASDAALVLPYDPVRDCVLVVEQVRFGPLSRGDRTCWQHEPIAGRIDPGEQPVEAARREAREEAGLEIGALELIAEAYPTPGTSTEFYFIYLGIADLPSGTVGSGGLEDENEDIRSHIWSFDELMARVARYDIANTPLVTCAYYLSHHRDRLRSENAGRTPGNT